MTDISLFEGTSHIGLHSVIKIYLHLSPKGDLSGYCGGLPVPTCRFTFTLPLCIKGTTLFLSFRGHGAHTLSSASLADTPGFLCHSAPV